jgi:hypothetical protein
MSLALAGPALAGTGRVLSPAAGESLTPGELVEVRWEALPSEVDELELLLEVDARADVRVRLTPQLAAATSSYLWRVPNLPGDRARLRVRFGRRGEEIECEPGAPFAIRPDPDTPLNTVRFRSGEWWLDGRLASPWAPLSGLTGEIAASLCEHPLPASAPSPDETPSPGPSRRLQPGDGTQAPGTRPERSGGMSRLPLDTPLRP